MFVTRRRHAAETTALRKQAAAAEARQAATETERQQLARQLAEADATARGLEEQLLVTGRRMAALAESDPGYAAALERRITRLQRVGARLLTVRDAERHRADRLQARLDEALGLDDTAVLAGRDWQRTRQDRKGPAS
ncbi:hypothetical protein [Streptomyces sp. SID8352]|uniref:hypothetical protein n=1 Tax=Streptomyces sp. SID8352 TaxID=2690338 RepID=UPI0013682E27|nr:hypothetical protein [Streptomyces sp. SID8352]MYU22909.1 hypothetical protein [Streptomyces sp. SID8352]